MRTPALLLALCLAYPTASSLANPIRVLVWDEQQPQQKQGYGDKFLGETIAEKLGTRPGLSVTSAHLNAPEQGLETSVLEKTDVLIWWGHVQHARVAPSKAEEVVRRVMDGKMSLIALHSAHWARPFVRLMQERAKADALEQIPASERAMLETSNESPFGKPVKKDTPPTPSLQKENGIWKLTLPACVFPAWRADGAPGHITTRLPQHPIAQGLPAKWDVAQTEMYNEPFHVPEPDAVIFEETWDQGEHFRSGCLWKVGRGQVFYFRPGHETFPVFLQEEPLRVLENAVRHFGTL
jgi:trehalose utilization protein